MITTIRNKHISIRIKYQARWTRKLCSRYWAVGKPCCSSSCISHHFHRFLDGEGSGGCSRGQGHSCRSGCRGLKCCARCSCGSSCRSGCARSGCGGLKSCARSGCGGLKSCTRCSCRSGCGSLKSCGRSGYTRSGCRGLNSCTRCSCRGCKQRGMKCR